MSGPATRAGGSARAMYRMERSRRRRWTAVSMATLGAAVPLVFAVAVGWGGTAVRGPVVAGAAAAVIVLAVTGWRLWRSSDVERWRRGADGEVMTAALLDALPPRGWAVWHDLRVPGSRANIDHLVVGRTGVWVIDTKTTRGTIRARWRSVRFGDRRLDTGPARWEAEVVADRLDALVGRLVMRPLLVRPLVAVHGRGLGTRGGRAGGVRVIPAGQLTRFVKRGRRRLARRDFELVIEAVESTFPPAATFRDEPDVVRRR